MAKISPVSIKYMIHASFEAFGPVEKPDVIGAIFGQTEGLLGSALEIRDLQKEGKIGRIEVETQSSGSKTKGTIQIPTALDQSETSLIAAAVETIDRVGPTEAKITIDKIEDVRGSKRDYILERAKKLLEGMQGPNSKEISGLVKTGTRAQKVKLYGDEELPSGDVDESDELIVVEGRADVINLLENRVDNVIGMNGTKLPKTIIELSKKKTIVLFVDGDRGGKLIAKNVIDNADINFVAFAPDGKEVEELSGKEILASLRKRIPAKEFSDSSFQENGYKKDYHERRTYNKDYGRKNYNETKIDNSDVKIDKDEFVKIVSSKVSGSKSAYLFDKNLNMVKSVSPMRTSYSISKTPGVVAVAIDGKATRNIIESSKRSGVKYIAAKTFEDADAEGIELISF